MRRKVKNKAFTITEVIATLVILGVILVVAIPGIGKLQTKFKKDYYEQLENSVIAAAKNYFKDNDESKPSGDLAIKKLEYNELLGAKYINSIKGYNNQGACTGFVAILKVKDKYTYTNCMECPSDNYKIYDTNSIVDPDVADEEDLKSNICTLASKEPSKIEAVYNTENLNPIYIYSNSYSKSELENLLSIQETITLKIKNDDNTYTSAYKVATGETIFPKNITAIDLSKANTTSNIKSSIKVDYKDTNNLTKERTIYVYDYEAPTISASGGYIVRSSSNKITISLSSIYFENDLTNQYPKLAEINGNMQTKLAPENFGGYSDELLTYYYSIDGQEWKEITTCNGNYTCEIFSNSIEETNKVKFRMKIKTSNNLEIFGKETDWYEVKAPITVTLDANGGSVSPTTMSVIYDSNYGTIPTPTWAGYTFIGWFNENYKANPLYYYADAYSDLKNAYGYNQDNLWGHYNNWGRGEGRRISQYISTDKVTATTDHTIYAGWKANSYTVSFNAKGGSVSPTSKSVTMGTTYGSLPEPVYANHVFNGWYTSETGGSQVTSTTIMNTPSNHTLYARWTEIVTVSLSNPGCTNKNLPEGVYYLEIIGGGAGGNGYGEWSAWKDYVGGNAARWAGYVYIPAINNASVCVGSGSAGKWGTSAVSNGGASYIANSSGTRLIEGMGGISRANKPYSNSVVKFQNGAVKKTTCKDIGGRATTTKDDYKGDGGYKVSIFGRFDNATDGISGIINYQYVKSLAEWEASPQACPATTLCSSSSCGW